jgi:MFS family permease
MSEETRRRWLLIAVALGVFVAADDQTSIVAVLPALINDIGLPVTDFYRSSWIVNGYLLGYIVALPLIGRVADMYGHARIYAAALGVFMLGSALVALAPTFETIVVFRALQAVGGGGVVPVAMAIMVTELPGRQRLMGLAAIAAASEGGALLGPLWGGAITEWFGWRTVFWINLPMAAPIALVVWRMAGSMRAGGRIDWPGAALLVLALGVLTFALVDDPNQPRAGALTVLFLLVAAAFAVAFWLRERRAPEPMVRVSMFHDRAILAANVASFLVGVGLITVLIGIPLFVNLVLVESPLDGGLSLMRLTVAVPLGALAGGWLGGRIGLNVTASIGMLCAAICFLGLATWDRELGQVSRTLPPLIGGFGFGLVIAPLGAAVLHRVEDIERATASSWLTLARISGMLVGAAMLTSTGLGRFYARAGAFEFGSPEFVDLVAEAQVETFHEVFYAGAVVMLVAAVVSWFIGRGRRNGDVDPWWTLT